MTKRIFRQLFGQAVIVGLLVILQIVILILSVVKLSDYFVYLYSAFELLSLGVALHVLNKKNNPTYKLAWVIPILLFPVFGGLFYLLVTFQTSTRRFTRRLASEIALSSPYLPQKVETLYALARIDPYPRNFAYYMKTRAGWPVYENASARYFPVGEELYGSILAELKKAKRYIFLEYFIIDEGVMWNSILSVLAEKAKEGVDVRILYDGMGTLFLLPRNYPEKLAAMGIKAKVFNPFVPILSTVQNNRDHRKILVIDGRVAFTGGINLADEYINKIERHGHWKDSGVEITGEGVYSFTMMFLQMWRITEKVPEDYEKYRPDPASLALVENDGFALPYGDSPLDGEPVGASVYLDIIQKAKNYVHIMTPYLVLDYELTNSLCRAAKAGVDVKIITPHIPDRWYMYVVAWDFYRELIASGVGIYEYTPGFIHCKSFVSDDETAVVGSINLDYRSLYLHFECACWFYRSKVVFEVERDFTETLAKCRRITLKDWRSLPWYKKLLAILLRIFAPLM